MFRRGSQLVKLDSLFTTLNLLNYVLYHSWLGGVKTNLSQCITSIQLSFAWCLKADGDGFSLFLLKVQSTLPIVNIAAQEPNGGSRILKLSSVK